MIGVNVINVYVLSKSRACYESVRLYDRRCTFRFYATELRTCRAKDPVSVTLTDRPVATRREPSAVPAERER